jgi:hypothetical protein
MNTVYISNYYFAQEMCLQGNLTYLKTFFKRLYFYDSRGTCLWFQRGFEIEINVCGITYLAFIASAQFCAIWYS